MPEGVVPRKAMPDLLLDVHLADGQLASMPIDSARAYRTAFYDAIFKRHGIDSTVFRRSIEFYATRPYLLNELYTDVEKRLEALNLAEQRTVDEKYKVQYRADSARNARRTDSLNRIRRDSLEVERKRYLLFTEVPDSAAVESMPVPVTPEGLRQYMMDKIGLSGTAAVKGAPAATPALPGAGGKPQAKPLEKIK